MNSAKKQLAPISHSGPGKTGEAKKRAASRSVSQIGPDHDPEYARPDAWAQIKAAVEPGGRLDCAFRLLEREAGMRVRDTLAAAIATWFTFGQDDRQENLADVDQLLSEAKRKLAKVRE